MRSFLGTEKVPQRNFVTKILPNVRVNFLVRFASKPLFYWILIGTPLGLFRKFFGAVRANFWLCGSFLAPEFLPPREKERMQNQPKVLLQKVFLRPPRVMDVRAFGARTSAHKTLFSCAPSDGVKAFGPGRPPGYPPGRPRDIQAKNFNNNNHHHHHHHNHSNNNNNKTE